MNLSRRDVMKAVAGALGMTVLPEIAPTVPAATEPVLDAFFNSIRNVVEIQTADGVVLGAAPWRIGEIEKPKRGFGFSWPIEVEPITITQTGTATYLVMRCGNDELRSLINAGDGVNFSTQYLTADWQVRFNHYDLTLDAPADSDRYVHELPPDDYDWHDDEEED